MMNIRFASSSFQPSQVKFSALDGTGAVIVKKGGKFVLEVPIKKDDKKGGKGDKGGSKGIVM